MLKSIEVRLESEDSYTLYRDEPREDLFELSAVEMRRYDRDIIAVLTFSRDELHSLVDKINTLLRGDK